MHIYFLISGFFYLKLNLTIEKQPLKGALENGVLGIQNCHKKSLKIKKIALRNNSEGVHY